MVADGSGTLEVAISWTSAYSAASVGRPAVVFVVIGRVGGMVVVVDRTIVVRRGDGARVGSRSLRRSTGLALRPPPFALRILLVEVPRSLRRVARREPIVPSRRVSRRS